MALGIWGAVAGLAIATGPVVGGAVVSGWSWQRIFWLNVPLGCCWCRSPGSGSPRAAAAQALDIPGVLLASAGLFGIVLGVVRANDLGWSSSFVVASMAIGAALIVPSSDGRRAPGHRCCRCGCSVARLLGANLASMLMFFGMFGSIFLLAQFLQTVQRYSPLRPGCAPCPGRVCR